MYFRPVECSEIDEVLCSSRSGLRVENMKVAGQKKREAPTKRRKSVKEGADGRAELALGALEGGVDILLAQVLPKALHQVQVV